MDPLALRLVRRFMEASDIERPEDKYSAGSLYYCPEDDTLFLTKRSGIMHHPYRWNVPGGRSDKEDETVDETCRRETVEELGKLPNDATLITVHRESWTKKGKPYHYYVYLYAISEEEKVRWTPKIRLDKESAGFKWFKLDEIPSEEEMNFDLSWIREVVSKKTKTASASRPGLALEGFKPRYEHKYWVQLDAAPAVRDFIRGHVTADDHGTFYPIQNVYYDNEGLEFFSDHMGHKESHFKLRARTYGSSSEVFLEVKQKSHGICSKTRSIVPGDQYAQILRTATSGNQIPFIRLALEHNSKPVIRLDYDREAYNAYESAGRVTIDTNIRYAKHSLYGFTGAPNHILLPPGVGILELKFSGQAPEFMQRLVKKFGLKRQSISKYCLSISRLLQSNELRLPQQSYYYGDV